MNRNDKLLVSIYALHGDTCGLAPHCKSLGCASGFDATDYVLAAKFAYLQEAIDYCQEITKRGVHVRLISKIVPTAPFIRDYAPPVKVVACAVDGIVWGSDSDATVFNDPEAAV